MTMVLCVGTDDVLMATRKMLLERAGHSVIAVKESRALIAACRENPIKVAVLGQNMDRESKIQAFNLIRQQCPGVRILSLYRIDTGRFLPGADDWLEVPTSVPSDFAERVSKLAR